MAAGMTVLQQPPSVATTPRPRRRAVPRIPQLSDVHDVVVVRVAEEQRQQAAEDGEGKEREICDCPRPAVLMEMLLRPILQMLSSSKLKQSSKVLWMFFFGTTSGADVTYSTCFLPVVRASASDYSPVTY